MATKKITELTETTSVINDDILPIVTDVGGSPVTKKIKVSTLFSDDIHNVALHTALGLTGVDGWIPDSDTWVYVSSTSFKIEGKDVTSKFPKGTKIRIDQTGLKYFYVISTAFSTDTTVTVTAGDDYTIANATISSPSYSYANNPLGFQHWFTWTPTGAGSGSLTFSSLTVGYAKFSISGDTLTYSLRVTGTTGGTTSTVLYATLPVNCTGIAVAQAGYVIDTTENGGWAFLNTTRVGVAWFDRRNWGIGAGRGVAASGSYQI